MDSGTPFVRMDSITEEQFNKLIELADDDTPGGSGLPEVTTDDNGDVLTVVEGQWAKATPSGGGSGGGLVVNFTLEAGTGDYDGYYIWVTETPAADVIAAIKAGTNVVFYLPGNGEVGVPVDQWIPVVAYVEPLEGGTTNAPFGNLLSSQSSCISSATIVDGEIIIEAYID